MKNPDREKKDTPERTAEEGFVSRMGNRCPTTVFGSSAEPGTNTGAGVHKVRTRNTLDTQQFFNRRAAVMWISFLSSNTKVNTESNTGCSQGGLEHERDAHMVHSCVLAGFWDVPTRFRCKCFRSLAL